MSKNHFGLILQNALKNRYGRIPSAAFIARQFNHRNTDGSTISDETARRWVRGYSVPDVPRIAILVSWLEIDWNKVFGVLEKNRAAMPIEQIGIEVNANDCSNLTLR